MSEIYSILGLPDTDRSYVNTIGQSVIYDAVQETLRRIEADFRAAVGVFVDETTSDVARRYKLAGGGYMQRRGRQAPPGAVKAEGHWDVAFPLEDFGAALLSDDVALAYMRLDELNRHMDSIEIQNRNTARREILAALLSNTVWSFQDETRDTPTLSVQPLANGDSVEYPPVIGANAEATENHYIETTYAVSAIDATHDPCESAVDELEEHFGSSSGGDEIVMFAGATLCKKISDTLTDFEDVDDRHIRQGANANEVVGLPANLPGKLVGRHRKGIWLAEWRYIPADYSLTVHMGEGIPRPLVQRVDPDDTGLAGGLQLVAVSDKFPLQGAYYRNRYGFGVGNRLNGLVQHFANSTYVIPTGFERGG